MRKCILWLLVLCMTVSVTALPALAAGDDTVDAISTVRALGIMTGDNHGNLNLQNNVTRAEFSKMLTVASSYQDTVGGSTGYSLFKDVKSSHWAVEYIKVAVDNGWFVGYMDGTFHPDSSIKLEEAATVALRLLGYTSSDLAGSYPTAQLSKFNALGLQAGITAQRGQTMTRLDCANLFYNLMAAKTKEGQVYAQTLGYTLDASGHVDYAALVTADTEGPFTLTDNAISLPFSSKKAQVYRDGAAASLSDAQEYDIYYYNANLRTVWIYSNRVTGTYTGASPSAAAPTSVTVAGVTYSIESSTAAYKLSTQGSYRVGDRVTLLLGMNGGVADVCDSTATSGVYFGVVRRSGDSTVTKSNGSVSVVRSVTVACTDGVERVFEIPGSDFSVGTAVRVDYGETSPVTRLSTKSTSGKVSSNGKKLGDLVLSDTVEILDTDANGNALRVYPSRLAGYTLSSASILYYEQDTNGEVTHLLLRDATGDGATYGLVLESNESTAQLNVSSSYRCLLDGRETTITSANRAYGASAGGARFTYDEDGELAGIRNLTKLNISALTNQTATASGKKYAVSEAVQVYIRRNGEYYTATLDSVAGSSQYTLAGYADELGYPAGGCVRILVATQK